MTYEQIVLGVDDSASSWQALGWAAHQAEITGRRLLVAYLGETQEQLGDYGYGNALAADVVRVLTENHPSLLAHTAVIEGDPAEFLLRAADDAAMLVLGREPSASSLTSLGPALAQIIAQSECPVVVSGPVAADTTPSTRIVLGVSGSAGGQAAMRFACEEAIRAGVAVLAVRSSSDPDWRFTEAAGSPSSPATRDMHEQDVLGECLDNARTQFPGVEISGLITGEATRFALAREAHHASLVALGRAPTDGTHGQEPGSDTLTAVYSLACAVAVVGAGRAPDGSEETERAPRCVRNSAFDRRPLSAAPTSL